MKLINLPNIITCCNLLCGCLSIYFCLKFGSITPACIFIIAGAVFDFFDGMTARALHISGPIGKELDSLADAVTFGVAPAALCYSILNSYTSSGDMGEWTDFLPTIAFIMAAFSALRLAKFNCDERQSLSFIGMPTPANALLWIGLICLNQIDAVHTALNTWLYIALMCICSYLLICELPMFSLKIKPGHMGLKENITRYTFLALTVAIIIVAAVSGYFLACFAPIILLYIIFSIIDNCVKH